jgi:hypothetical protein
MDNVQKRNIFTNVPSSQAFRSYSKVQFQAVPYVFNVVIIIISLKHSSQRILKQI